MFWLVSGTLLSMLCGGLSDRSTTIAVYDNTSSPSCVDGADYQYKADELPHHLAGNIKVRLCSNRIQLERVISISQVSNVTVVGYGYPVLTCRNGTSAGLNFTEIDSLTLSHFKIEGCGFPVEIIEQQKNLMTSITVQGCTDFSVVNVSVTDGPGIGLTLLGVSSVVEILDSIFGGNGLNNEYSGSGIYLMLTDTYIDGNTTSFTEITIKQCKFLHNMAKTGSKMELDRFDNGGGICIYVINGSNISVTISNSTFIGNEVRKYGGAVYASFSEAARNNLLTVETSYFSHNRAKYGGAMHVEYVHSGGRHKQAQTPLNCSFLFESNRFENNYGVFGGGISLFSVKNVQRDPYTKVVFNNCTLKHNTAQYGSAIAILPNAWNSYTQGYLPEPVFKGCAIEYNVVLKAKLPYARNYSNQSVRGAGALYCFGHSLTFENENTFTHNKGSSMYLGFASVTFAKNSVTNFANNSAYYGGAIHLLVSVIYIRSDTRVYFTHNRASGRGGAIYQESPEVHTVDYSQTCFINYINSPNENVSVVFTNNAAGNHSGHSIFTTSLLPCCRQFQNCDGLSKYIFNTTIGNISYFPPDRSNEIVTDINHADFEAQNTLNSFAFIPGKEKELSHTNLDDLNQTTSATFLVTIDHAHGSKVNTSSEFSVISGNTLKLYGRTTDSANVTLSSISSRKIALRFKAKMQACPPGYIQHFDKNTQLISCICSVYTENSYRGIVKCNSTLMQAYRNLNYWIGYDKDKKETEDSLWSGHCPNNFCQFNKGTLLPPTANRTLLCAMACSGNHTGTLCGKCVPGTSVHYHSLMMDCKVSNYCHLGWLFYILSEIVPVTAIFLVILLFNIPFTTGTVNSFVFFSQILIIPYFKADSFPDIARTILRVSRFVYLFFNLDVFVLDEISYCLWTNATSLDILSFNFITMIYSFVLIILVIFIRTKCTTGCCNCAFTRSSSSNRFTLQGNIIHGLSSFLILFSSHCMKISIMVLRSTTIYNKGSKNSRKVVHYNGEIDWMSFDHLPYAFPALIMLFAILIPSVLLIVYPLHYRILSILRVSESRHTRKLFGPLERLKPFFDSFQGSFKDNFRFFSGLYFIYRFSFFMIMIWMVIDDAFFAVSIMLGLILIIHSVLQPYRERLHNAIDVILLGNLTLINLMTAYNVSKTDTAGSISSLPATVTLWVQVILIHVPLLCALLYFVKVVCTWVYKKWFSGDSSVQLQDNSAVTERIDYGTF